MKTWEYSLWALITLCLFTCLYPFGHGDALYYHLVGPKLFSELGFFKTHQSFLPFLQAGYFDYLYWPIVGLFGNTLWAQLTAQLLHYGALFAGLMLLVKTHRIFSTRVFSLLFVLSCLSLARSQDFLLYAKNDGVAAVLVLLACSFIFEAAPSYLLGGLFAGLAVGSKLSGLFYIAPLGLMVLIIPGKAKDKALFFAVAFFVALPILARNYAVIGNPLHPAFIKYLPGEAPASMISYFTGNLAKSMTWAQTFTQLKSFLLGKAIALAIPLLLLAGRSKSFTRRDVYYLIVSALGFTLYLIQNGGILAERFIFASYLLNILVALRALEKLAPSGAGIFVLVVLILLDSRIDHRIKRSLHFFSHFTFQEKELRAQMLPHTQIWKFIPKGSSVVSHYWSNQFYAQKNTRLYQHSAAKEVEWLGKCQNISELQERVPKIDFVIARKRADLECFKKLQASRVPIYEDSEYQLFAL